MTAGVNTHTLAVLLPPGWPLSTRACTWWWRDARGALHTGSAEDLAALPREAVGARLRVWTPGMETLLTRARVPTRSRAKILQALPFALEEQLLGEPEQMHFTYQPLPEGELAVAVTERERVEAWHAAFHEARLHPASMAPAQLALPLLSETWTVAFGADEVWLRTGAYSGIATVPNGDGVLSIFASAVAEARMAGQAPGALVVLNAPTGFNAEHWGRTLGLDVRSQDFEMADAWLAAPGLSLTQADLGEGRRWLKRASVLRPAAVMLAVWFVAYLGFSAVEWGRLSHTATAQQARMLALFRQSFPDARAVVDPPLQMQRNLASLRARSGIAGPGDFLPLVGRVAPVLQANAQVQVQSLQYGDGALNLEVNAPSFQMLDSVKSALTRAGLRVEVVSANSRATGVDGRLRVNAGTP